MNHTTIATKPGNARPVARILGVLVTTGYWFWSVWPGESFLPGPGGRIHEVLCGHEIALNAIGVSITLAILLTLDYLASRFADVEDAAKTHPRNAILALGVSLFAIQFVPIFDGRILTILSVIGSYAFVRSLVSALLQNSSNNKQN